MTKKCGEHFIRHSKLFGFFQHIRSNCITSGEYKAWRFIIYNILQNNFPITEAHRKELEDEVHQFVKDNSIKHEDYCFNVSEYLKEIYPEEFI